MRASKRATERIHRRAGRHRNPPRFPRCTRDLQRPDSLTGAAALRRRGSRRRARGSGILPCPRRRWRRLLRTPFALQPARTRTATPATPAGPPSRGPLGSDTMQGSSRATSWLAWLLVVQIRPARDIRRALPRRDSSTLPTGRSLAPAGFGSGRRGARDGFFTGAAAHEIAIEVAAGHGRHDAAARAPVLESGARRFVGR